jgi:dodecin
MWGWGVAGLGIRVGRKRGVQTPGENPMPDKTYKIVDVVGVSDQSIHQAVRNAVKKASQTLRHLDWFEVQNIRGSIDAKGEPEFQVTLRIGFRLEGGPV